MLKAMVAGQTAETHDDMYCSQYDYYQDYYPQQPELCPAHAQLCTVHGEYGPVTVPMVSTNSSPPIAMPVQVPPGHVVQQIVDESGTLRHVILSPQPPIVPMPPPHYGPGPGTSTNQPPQPFFAPQGLPPGYHFGHGSPMQPGVMGHGPPPTQQAHSPPPPLNFKDERTQRQYIKLKKKLEQKHMRVDNVSITSSQVTPPISPRKELANGVRRGKDRGMSSVGTSEDGEESSSVQEDEEEDVHLIMEMLSTVKPPQVAELSSRSALLHWLPPERFTESPTLEGKRSEFDFSDADLCYEVLLSDKGKEGKYKSIYSGVSLSCRIEDLRPGTEYSVCLQVQLEELQSSVSEPTTFVTPACEPDQPQPPKLITRSRTSLQLRWNGSADNGSHITHYILEYDEGRDEGFVEVFKSRGKQHNLAKLQASTGYKFRLAAVNAYGKSCYSDVVQFSTSGSPPSQPTPPVLKEASVTSLHLAWQMRPFDDDFSLQMDHRELGHGFLPVYNGKDLHYVCDGLRRHTEYWFRLRAHNEEGPSRWSDEVCYRTLPDRPATPSRPTVKGRVHAQTFKMKWDPPSDCGGADITTYLLELDGGSGFETAYTGSETEFICDRLTPGTTYQLRVSCISAGGRSKCSDPCIVTTEAVCPGKCSPPRLHGKPRATSLALKWSYPEYDGGAPLSEFEVEMTSPNSSRQQTYRGKDAECIVSNLCPGQTYVFQVRAFNRVGPGPWSDSLEVMSGAAPPDTPREPAVICRSSHHAVVHWDEPSSNGAPITEYRLEMSMADREPDYTTVFHGLNNSHEIKGLSAATPYYFRIQACNSAGWSGVSATCQTITPPSSPAAVCLPRYVATPTTLKLSWQEPACHGADILHYNIDMSDHVKSTSGPAVEHALEGLIPDTTYRLRVQAVNNVGPGPFSPILRATTLPLPPAPPKLECAGVGHNYLKLKWGDGKNPNFNQYMVESENTWTKEFQCVYQGTSHTCKVNRLQEMTMYRFRIAAANGAGQGHYSEIYEFSTCIAPPPSLKAPKFSDIQQRSCVVEWNACKPIGSDPVVYQVQLSRLRDQEYKQVYRGAETKVQLNDLEPGADYSVRVCPVRQATIGDLCGVYSPSSTFSTLLPDLATVATTKTAILQVTERKPLSDQQWALIILCGFTLFALLTAVVMQKVIHWSKGAP
ncbi:fibronectin type-III domain-containing protein 3A isoform X2 [Zootermopsis nevadensis]|uniref:fibronectin type-III domain-containing protein 3A isoform X2 n=1 Tax=Zootermopsis nevadensis TaxID=136037 RepID=UPI000B8EDFE1|nr:fibronectin type-III domain-containing protein 3A isoform X2 [Zootermopsis nevadensis]